jgi:malonyl-CoA O-methyltransferase
MSVALRFDRAAAHYDQAASIQSQVAEYLVSRAVKRCGRPASVLDLGCGTGFVAQAARRRWPGATLTALDASPAMLHQAQRKIPGLRVVTGDAAHGAFGSEFDTILSSMALHWLADPHAVLRRWQRWLKPGGLLSVALLVEGSFQEWGDICRMAGREDGLWPMPPADFADDLAVHTEQQTMSVTYRSAQDFLRRLKVTGAAAPRPGYRPARCGTMRQLLAAAPSPFMATYQVLYLDVASPDSI